MTAVVVTALQILSCIGFGAMTMRVFHQDKFKDSATHIILAFAIGVGVLGWLMFFVGIAGFLSLEVLLALLLVGILGVVILLDPALIKPIKRLDWLEWVLIAGIILALTFDLLEGLSPPADGDSLAYHFDLPKEFLLAGKIEFVPRIIDGAIPLLVQMTYIPMLEIGGEKAMTLWTMASGWGVAALLFSFSRSHLNRPWSLALTLIYLTTPAVVFGGGSGHVEVRLSLFVLIAAFFIIESLHTNDIRHTILAGLGIGFFMGAKYTGLLFACTCGLVLCGLLLTSNRRWFLHAIVLVISTMLAGSQWYIWNWIHTGDPVFPILFNLIDYGGVAAWDSLHHKLLQDFIATAERSVPINFWWYLSYPFVATFNSLPTFESGRIGMGPYAILLLPFVLGGAWRFRHRLTKSKLWSISLIVLLFYTMWFFAGNSQRVRHLLPIYPLLLICLTAAAHRWVSATGHSHSLILAIILTIGIQLGGHGLFAINFARYVFSSESRDHFLARNVNEYEAIKWINDNLKATDTVYSMLRHVNYLFEIPNYYAHFIHEVTTDIRPTANNPKLFFHQLNKLKITHILVEKLSDNRVTGFEQWRPLAARGCLDQIKSIQYVLNASRTLSLPAKNKGNSILYKIKNGPCFEKP